MKPRLLVVLAVLVPLAGCGSGSGGGNGDADPAKLVPASAPVYVEITARPEGSTRDDAEAAAKKLLKTDDPGAKAQQLFDQAFKDQGVSWKDFEPWLGQRVGAFFTSFADKAQGAFVFASTDDGKAKDTLGKLLRKDDNGKAQVSERKYKDVSYDYDATDQDALGIVDGYAVFGSESGFKQVVDTSKGAASITANKDFAAGRDAVGADDSLANVWANPQTLLDAIGANKQANQALPVLRQVFAQLGRSAAGSFLAGGDALKLNFAAIGAPESGAAKSGAQITGALPADAWLAIGLADVGNGLRKGLGQITNLGNLGGFDVGGVMSQFEAASGLNLERDLLSWIGDAAVYARGKSLADLGIVLTLTSTKPERSKAAPRAIAHALHQFGASVRPADVPGYDNAYAVRAPGLPFAFYVAGSEERVSL